MDTEKIHDEITRLRREIERHNHSYYVDNAPTVSDHDFDILMKRLEELEKEHPEWDDPDSPTHRVGSDLSKGSFRRLTYTRCCRWATPIRSARSTNSGTPARQSQRPAGDHRGRDEI